MANSILQQCTHAEAVAWKIPDEFIVQLTSLTQHANAAYEDNSDLATKNRTTSTAKKMAFKNLKHFLGSFIKYLQGNLLVPNDALERMGLPSRVHHARRALPRPYEAPVISTTKQRDEITVHVARPAHEQHLHTISKTGYYGFKLRYKKDGDPAYKEEIVTKLHATIRFQREDDGKKVVIAAAWVNPTMQEGPWSQDVTEIIG